MTVLNKKIAILGGDEREIPTLFELQKAGAQIAAAARDSRLLPQGVSDSENILRVLENADCVILPLPGLQKRQQIYNSLGQKLLLAREHLAVLRPGTPVLIGVANEWLKEQCYDFNLDLYITADDPHLAAAGAVAAAEGAISLAISESRGLLSKSLAILIGYGRLGRALAVRLTAMGCQVIVSDCSQEALSWAQKNGLSVVKPKFMPDLLDQVDLIFNTAPAPVLKAAEIELVPLHAVIIDLASSPGGTDFSACKARGIKAQLASGLPGKYAPDYMARLVKKVYLPLIEKLFDENFAVKKGGEAHD
ncbi:MAG: dipicolinate synthase subunit DpsA [Bacillota bacterium]